MMGVTPEAIQLLLDRPKGVGFIVSCYTDTSVAHGSRSFWSQGLKNEARAIAQRLTDATMRARFFGDLKIVRRALAEPGVRRARGLAVFSAAEQGLFRAFPLGVPVTDRLVLDEAPYIVPLLEALHRQRRYLVVVTNSHRGRLYEAAWGHTHLLQTIEEDVPRRQRSAGETWGKQQATIARHREDCLLHYRKDLARLIEQVWPSAPFRGLILLGPQSTIAALRVELPGWLAERIVHTGRYQWTRNSPAAIVRSVLDEALHAHDAGLIQEFEWRLRENHYIAAGPGEVLPALHNGQVGYPGFLLLEPDRGDLASRCEQCGSLSTVIHARCPVCGGTCDTVNLWQEILLFAARHNITAHPVDHNEALANYGGVAAVLSRRHPWDLAAPGAAAG